MKTKIFKKGDKVNDEFIVDCTNNSTQERQQVYKFLVDNRNYEESYLNADYPIIVCNKESGASKWSSLELYYNWMFCKKGLLIYTFEQFKEMYLEEEFVLPEKWCIKSNRKETYTKYLVPYLKQINYHSTDWDGKDYYYHVFKNNCSAYTTKEHDYKEITFEQFLKYVLKQEIIGYKLVKPEYKEAYEKITNTTNLDRIEDSLGRLSWVDKAIKDLKEAGVLELWFKPNYKEEFQVGDWVYIDMAESGAMGAIGNVGVITNNKSTSGLEHKTINVKIGLSIWSIGFKAKLRKATKEEIEKASEQTVSMNGKFNLTIRNKRVFHQNEDITSFVESVGENWEHRIKNFSYNNYAFTVKDVILSKTGCQSQETYLSDWLKVYDLIK